MRILDGRWAGVTLVSPGRRVRPTTEELRDLWMDDLAPVLEGARILDLFSGTGALGLEALSRGARSVDFVETGAEALHALKANRAKLRATRTTRLFKKEAFSFIEGIRVAPASGEGEAGGGGSNEPKLPYDLALADPPYTSAAAERLVVLWLKRPFSAILSVEHPRELTLPGKGSRRVHEDSAFTTYRLSQGPDMGSIPNPNES